jgi:hypothetical protein
MQMLGTSPSMTKEELARFLAGGFADFSGTVARCG